MSLKSALLTPLAVRQGQRLLGDLGDPVMPDGAPHGLAGIDREPDAEVTSGPFGARIASPATPPLSLVLLGDELAAGAGAAHGEEALPRLVAEAVAQRRGRRVLWQTMGEHQASSLRLHGRQLVQLAPTTEVAVVLVGLHDLLARHTVEEWRREMSASLALLSGVPEVVVCGCPPVAAMPVMRWPMGSTLGEAAARLDEVTRELCAEHGAHFVPLRHSVPVEPTAARPSKEAAGDEGFFAADGLHPSPALQRRWTQLVADALG